MHSLGRGGWKRAVEVPRWPPTPLLTRVIDAIFVDDQGVGERADLQHAVPIATGTRQARNLQTEEGANVTQTDLDQDVLEAITTGERGAGVGLILVNDLN